MSLKNKFLISLFFLSIFFINTNAYSIFPSSELNEFEQIFQKKSKKCPNLKKMALEYDPTYYGAILIGCNRKLNLNLDTKELVEAYAYYAVNDKFLKFMNFYDNEKNKYDSPCTGEFLKKAYKFLDILKNHFEFKDAVTSFYLEDFWFDDEIILICLIDTVVTDILKNKKIEYREYIEPISDLRQMYCVALEKKNFSEQSSNKKRKIK